MLMDTHNCIWNDISCDMGYDVCVVTTTTAPGVTTTNTLFGDNALAQTVFAPNGLIILLIMAAAVMFLIGLFNGKRKVN